MPCQVARNQMPLFTTSQYHIFCKCCFKISEASLDHRRLICCYLFSFFQSGFQFRHYSFDLHVFTTKVHSCTKQLIVSILIHISNSIDYLERNNLIFIWNCDLEDKLIVHHLCKDRAAKDKDLIS